MAETNAEGLNVACVEETSQGASPPPTSIWNNLEVDAIGDPGADYKKMGRTPFTITRQKRRPFISGMDVAFTLDLDVTKDHVDVFGEAIFKSEWKHSGGTDQSKFAVQAVVDGGVGVDSFTVLADGDLAQNTLVRATGLANPENNSVFVVAAGSDNDSINVPTGSLVAEATPPDNAIVEVCGYQFPAGDLELDDDGNFTCTADDFTTKGLQVGQEVYIPSPDEALAMGDADYGFSNADYYGFCEIVSIAAKKLTVRKRDWTVGAATTEASSTVRMFFTKFIRNVARNSDDEKLVSHAFEVTYSDLAAGPADAYEYILGCMLDKAVFNMPAEGKVTMQLTFVGKTAENPSTDRHTGPSDALNPVTGLAISTSSDIKRLSVENTDESGLMTDFKDMKITFANNVVGEKAVGHLGNRFTPIGVFEAMMDADAFFTTPDIVTAVGDNRILRLSAGGRNDEFGMVIDIPSTGSLESKKKIEHNKLVSISSKIDGFMDATLAYTAGISVFAYLPIA